MSDKRSNEKLDSLRERLYARGETPKPQPRPVLKDEQKVSTRKVWDDISVPLPPKEPRFSVTDDISSPTKSTFGKYRSKLILVGVAFFLISVLISSVYMLLGQNTVSGSNISIDVTGPFSVGGGEVLPLQVGLTNHNGVPIEAATIVVHYPAGTRSGEGEDREMFSERITVPSSIAAGETRNIPLKARVFGEENQEAEVKVSVEYRMIGSSATFYKEAEPLRFKISHAPIVMKVETSNAISSGQEANIKLTITSNSPSPIYNLLVEADYPNSFSFTRSEPAPVSGRNIWSIKEIKPEESITINLSGVVSGATTEKYVLKFATGVASEKNPNELSSVLAVADTEFVLENPFLSTTVSINGSTDEEVSVAPNSQANVVVDLRNDSETPVYDAVVEVVLSGNALVDGKVSVNNGYYDSNTNTIRFDSSSSRRLGKLNPGDTEKFSFNLIPEGGGSGSPEVRLELVSTGRRVSESSAREEISGTVKRTIKLEGSLSAAGKIIDVTGGAVPPTVGRTTSYRIGWSVENSGNPLSGAVMTATLPAYVDWDGNGSGDGTWSYNSSDRTVEWRVGSVGSGDTASGTFGVSFLPSTSLIDKNPTLIEDIELRADDSFTGTVLRSSAGSVSAELPGQRGSGTVQSN